jgi:hypothetical protein
MTTEWTILSVNPVTGATTVRFDMTGSWAATSVSTISFNFGDATPLVTLTPTVISRTGTSSSDMAVVSYTTTHVYTKAGNYEAFSKATRESVL